MLRVVMQKLYKRDDFPGASPIDITDRIYAESFKSIFQKLEIGRFAFYVDDVKITANNHDGFFDFLAESHEDSIGANFIVLINSTELFRGDVYRYEPEFSDNKCRTIDITLRNTLARTSQVKLSEDIKIRGGISAFRERIMAMIDELNSDNYPGIAGIAFDDDIEISPFELDMRIDQAFEDIIFDSSSNLYLGLIIKFDKDFGDFGRIRYSIVELESKTEINYLRSLYVIPSDPDAPVPSWDSPKPIFIRACAMSGYICIYHLGRIIIAELEGTSSSVILTAYSDDEIDKILIRRDGSISMMEAPVQYAGNHYFLKKRSAGLSLIVEKYHISSRSLIGRYPLSIPCDTNIHIFEEDSCVYISDNSLMSFNFETSITTEIARVPNIDIDSHIIPVVRGPNDIAFYYNISGNELWYSTDSTYFTINNIKYPAQTSLFDMLCDLAQFIDGCLYTREGRIYFKSRRSFIDEHCLSSEYLSNEIYLKSFVNIAAEMPTISITASGISDDATSPFSNKTVMGSIRDYYRKLYSNVRRRRVFRIPQSIAREINIGDRVIIDGDEEESGLVIERKLNIALQGELSEIVIEGDII